MEISTEEINCPCCNGKPNTVWAKENGYNAVKCKYCGLVYVNPRPKASMISEAVKTGMHRGLDIENTVITRRNSRSVSHYKKLLDKMFCDVWRKSEPVSWLDVGAGYGEFLEAVIFFAAPGSQIDGLEPMKPKADEAKKRGLNVQEIYLHEIKEKYDYLSLINVFSHIPDFHDFLKDVRKVLKPNGEFFLETGNIADLISNRKIPTELNLPDHLVFAGEKTIRKFLNDANFSIIEIRTLRKDTIFNFIKNIVKKLLGRQVILALPYTSPFRSMLIRAKLNSHAKNAR